MEENCTFSLGEVYGLYGVADDSNAMVIARRCSGHTPSQNSIIFSRNRVGLIITWIFCCFLSVTSSTEIDLSMLSSAAGFQIAGSAAGDRVGVSVSGAGDVNGDGVDDILIGGNRATVYPGETNGGIVYVVFGNKTAGSLPNLDMQHFTTSMATGFCLLGRANMLLGNKVSRAGDIDADGYDDFMVSAPGATSTTNRPNAGLSFVIFGREVVSPVNAFYDFDMGSFSTNAVGFRILGAVAGDQSGTGLSAAGDVNGDGIDDILVGAIQATYSTRNTCGVVYVIFGQERVGGVSAFTGDVDLSNMPFSTGYRMYGAYAGVQMGRVISSTGDFDGDGIKDILIGVPLVGKAYVVFGHTDSGNIDLLDAPGAGLAFTITDSNTDNQLGNAVAGLGDVNGDGQSDIIIGAPSKDAGPDLELAGVSYVLFGRGARSFNNLHLTQWITNSTNGFRIFGTGWASHSGYTVGGGGDVNYDGINDILIGAYAAGHDDKYETGAVYVVFGKLALGEDLFNDVYLATIASGGMNGLVIYGAASNDWLSAYAVDIAGDVNNDGIADIITGAYKASPSNKTEAGMGYVVYGALPAPTVQPSSQPSSQPSRQPSRQPTRQPTRQPSAQPSRQPSTQPSRQPSSQPSSQPSFQLSAQPSRQPTRQPSSQPSSQPLGQPTSQPSGQPSKQPSGQPSIQPSKQPSQQPTMSPSRRPSAQPTIQPTQQPSLQLTSQPSSQPTGQPSLQPVTQPTSQPSNQPSRQPTGLPTVEPSVQPSSQPSFQPSLQPSAYPSKLPSAQPTVQPSSTPSVQPSSKPSSQPSVQPFARYSKLPTGQPSAQPTVLPSSTPNASPSTQPSSQPTSQPTCLPSRQPSGQPTYVPSALPTNQPTAMPSLQPSLQPSSRPSVQPSSAPISQPTTQLVSEPSGQPSAQPSCLPSSVPPSAQPSSQPSAQPSLHPITHAMVHPTPQPSLHPSQHPSLQPTKQPSAQPSVLPTTQRSSAPTVVPNGEWAITLGHASAVESIARIDDTLWICYADTGKCATIGAILGNIIAEYAFPWETTIHVQHGSASSEVLTSGCSTSGLSTESIVARCTSGSTEQIICNMFTFSGVSWVSAAANSDFNKIVHIGSTTAAAVATIFDTITNTAATYAYTSYLLKTTVLQSVQSIPNFVGTFVAGACVTNTVIPQNCIFTGWLRTDKGTMDAMYLTPGSGTIRNTALLVTSLAVEANGPDSFIAGGLELNGVEGVHAYLVRMNTLYRTVKYGMRYRISVTPGSTTSGNRRTLSETTIIQSAVSTTLLLNNNLYMVINYNNSNNSSAAFLNINAINGGIVKQVYLAVTSANLQCSDITASGLFLAVACTVQNSNISTSVLLSVNRDLSFAKLPAGFIRHQNHVASVQSVPFRATVVTMSTQSIPVSAVTSRQQVISDELPDEPTAAPSILPSLRPFPQPSSVPSGQPSSSPTSAPSVSPQPSSHPSTGGPTNTYEPTVKPTPRPSAAPSRVPSASPTVKPSVTPTARSTVQPSAKPTAPPSPLSTTVPSIAPLVASTKSPVCKPTTRPISLRSRVPTCIPTVLNQTEYVESGKEHSDGRPDATMLGLAAAGAMVGVGLLLILCCAWCQHTRMEKIKKKAAAKAGQKAITLSGMHNASVAEADDSDFSVNLSSLHSSEVSYFSPSEYTIDDSKSLHGSEMSWTISPNMSGSSLNSGSEYSLGYKEWEVENSITSNKSSQGSTAFSEHSE